MGSANLTTLKTVKNVTGYQALRMNELSLFSSFNYYLELRKTFLMYLDSEGILNQLKIAGLEYKQNIRSFAVEGIYNPPFRFVMRIDLLRMQVISHELTMFFIRDPIKCLSVAEELVSYVLKVLNCVKLNSAADIQVIFQITSFPNITHDREFIYDSTKGLTVINGILTGRTTVNKYTRSKVFFCNIPQCQNSKKKRYNPPFRTYCCSCYSYMEEDVRSLDTGEEIYGQIISLRAFSKIGRFQATKIKIRDELCYYVSLDIGTEYNLTGIFDGNYFIVWNIDRKPAKFELLSNLPKLQSIPIPQSFADLYYRVNNDCPQSPWAFVGAISTNLASEVLPVSSFLQLKTGVLLSLATQNSEDAPIPLVAVGTDALAVQKLIKISGKLAERFVNYSAGFELAGEKKCNLQEVWYEAGALILATTGICNLGDWSRFRKDQCSYICQVIESGKIILNSTDKNKTETDFVPLKCAIWTYWCQFSSSHQDRLQLKTLLNVFGMLFLADENNELEVKKICHKILFLSTRRENESPKSSVQLDEFKEFISVVNSRNLVLNKQASKLIHDFFVIIRKERPECIPVGAIKIITSLAEAHARLSLRNEIEYEDVIAVLYLYNESISKIFGSPVIFSKLPELVESDEIHKFIHDNIKHFKIDLEKYLENYLFL